MSRLRWPLCARGYSVRTLFQKFWALMEIFDFGLKGELYAPFRNLKIIPVTDIILAA